MRACLDVVEGGVDAEGQVAGKRPGGGGPGHHLSVVRIVVQRKSHLQDMTQRDAVYGKKENGACSCSPCEKDGALPLKQIARHCFA